LVGKLPNGLRVADSRVSPETVEVLGPASAVDDVTAPETEPLDLSHAAPGKIERELALPSVSEYVSFSAQRVAAQVQIAESEAERELRRVPVAVRNAPHGRVDPPNVRIVIRGPKHVVESLELSHGEVYIDAADMTPGRYERTPTVDLPAGVELIRQEPPTVQLRITKGRR